MKADELNRWLTLIANISVVAGIVFLAVEIRQNTESQQESLRLARATAYQERAFAAVSRWASNASSPELIAAIVVFDNAGGVANASEALAALSAHDRWHIHFNMLAQIATLDNNVYQFKEGYLDPDRYNRIDAVALLHDSTLFDALGFVYTTPMTEEIERLRQRQKDE